MYVSKRSYCKKPSRGHLPSTVPGQEASRHFPPTWARTLSSQTLPPTKTISSPNETCCHLAVGNKLSHKAICHLRGEKVSPRGLLPTFFGKQLFRETTCLLSGQEALTSDRPFATYLGKKLSLETDNLPPIWARSSHVRQFEFATCLGKKKLSREIFVTFLDRSSPRRLFATFLGKKLSSEIIATYLGKKLSHKTVPLSAVLVFEAVGPVVHPFERVVELWDTHKN